MRGAFILIEGLDRAGKSSQCERLVKKLTDESKTVVLKRFPDRTTHIGQLINGYLTSGTSLSDQAIHLLFSANRWEATDEMRELLENGTTIIVDRYYYSGIAFSAAKGTLSIDWCKQPDVGLPAPDLTLFLKVSQEVAISRGGFGNERYEKLDFQRKVSKIFDELISSSDNCHVIDADQGFDQVSNDIDEKVSRLLAQSLGPIQRYV